MKKCLMKWDSNKKPCPDMIDDQGSMIYVCSKFKGRQNEGTETNLVWKEKLILTEAVVQSERYGLTNTSWRMTLTLRRLQRHRGLCGRHPTTAQPFFFFNQQYIALLLSMSMMNKWFEQFVARIFLNIHNLMAYLCQQLDSWFIDKRASLRICFGAKEFGPTWLYVVWTTLKAMMCKMIWGAEQADWSR